MITKPRKVLVIRDEFNKAEGWLLDILFIGKALIGVVEVETLISDDPKEFRYSRGHIIYPEIQFIRFKDNPEGVSNL